MDAVAAAFQARVHATVLQPALVLRLGQAKLLTLVKVTKIHSYLQRFQRCRGEACPACRPRQKKQLQPVSRSALSFR